MDRRSEFRTLSLLGLLLILVLALLAFTMAQTFRAVGSFQQRSRAVKAGDVSTVRPWMTVHAVSHIYKVPESYLCQELQISNPSVMRHVTLNGIAMQKKQSVNQVIHTVQRAIVVYRKKYPHPVPSPKATPPRVPAQTPPGLRFHPRRALQRGLPQFLRGGKGERVLC